MEKAAKPAQKDALFVSIQDTIWTVADHHRLYAVDRLQTQEGWRQRWQTWRLANQQGRSLQAQTPGGYANIRQTAAGG